MTGSSTASASAHEDRDSDGRRDIEAGARIGSLACVVGGVLRDQAGRNWMQKVCQGSPATRDFNSQLQD